MRIGEIAEKTGLSISNIRFYERKGLIGPDREQNSKYRNYTDADLIRLKQILLYRKMDFSIEIISNILEEKITLEDVIENQLLELENKKDSIQSSIDLCQKIVSDGKFTSDDTDFYLAYVKEEEEKGKVFGRLDDFLDEVTDFGEYLLQASSAEMFIINQFRRNRALSFIVIIAILVCPAIAVVEDIFCGNGIRVGTIIFCTIWWLILISSYIAYRRSK